MPLHFKVPVVEYRKLPPLFYASLGALLGLLIATFVLTERADQKNLELIKDFGGTVVAMAAHEIVDAAVSEDLVSMHAILQEVIAQPRIKMATVHNMEQQLLVQAGQLKNALEYQVFTAPIALHNSIAGQVSVTVETGFPGDQAVRWTLAGTAILLGFMVLLSLYETRGYAWYLRERAEGEADEDLDEVTDGSLIEDRIDELDDGVDESPLDSAVSELPDDEYFAVVQDDDDKPFEQDDSDVADAMHDYSSDEARGDDESGVETKPDAFYSDLIIALPNYSRLQQQLHSDRFNPLVQSFEQDLSEVLSLYGGVRLGPPHNNNVYCVRFTSNESFSEAAFRASCSAQLMFNLNATQKVRFNILAEISHPDEDVKMAVSQIGIFIQGILVDSLLKQRLKLDALEDDRFKLLGFHEPYAALLESQQLQLLGGH